MTRAEARRILDAVREGADVSPEDIAAALRVTGDDRAEAWLVSPLGPSVRVPADWTAPVIAPFEAEEAHDDAPRQVVRPAGTWRRHNRTVRRQRGPFDGLGGVA